VEHKEYISQNSKAWAESKAASDNLLYVTLLEDLYSFIFIPSSLFCFHGK